MWSTPVSGARGAGAVEGEVVDDRGNRIAGAKVAKNEVPDYLPLGPLPPGVVQL